MVALWPCPRSIKKKGGGIWGCERTSWEVHECTAGGVLWHSILHLVLIGAQEERDEREGVEDSDLTAVFHSDGQSFPQ